MKEDITCKKKKCSQRKFEQQKKFVSQTKKACERVFFDNSKISQMNIVDRREKKREARNIVVWREKKREAKEECWSKRVKEIVERWEESAISNEDCWRRKGRLFSDKIKLVIWALREKCELDEDCWG